MHACMQGSLYVANTILISIQFTLQDQQLANAE